MSTLVIAEINNKQLAASTLNAIFAASQLSPVDILIAGENVANIAEEAKNIDDINHVLTAEASHYAQSLAEEIAPLVVSLANDYDTIVAAASSFGKNILPRVAALLDCPMISDVSKIIDKETFVHPIYAGNAFETIKVVGKKVLSFRATAFDAAKSGANNAEIKAVSITNAQNLSRFISQETHVSERPELTQARIVVSGGRGVGSKEKFDEVIVPLADALGAAVGASRAAVDAEYAPNDFQVGQTGKVVAPELYIAVGISGAIQHLAGMQDSKVIVAINKDPEAPIFNVADYGLVEDLFTAAPKLLSLVKS